jgi:hypothetical protein
VRRVLVLFALLMSLVALPAGVASAHVHGITPLLTCGGDPSITGANRTDTTPASATMGGPIGSGLIPTNVGEADDIPGDGGADAAAIEHCQS